MDSDVSALFVRLPASEGRQLEMAVAASGKTKRQLVSEAVREHLTDDGLVVGHASIQETGDEVMTVGEAAVLLKLDESTVLAAAESLDLPGRQIDGHWRFSRSAVLAWLSGDGGEEPSSDASRSA
jgi:excisionase family DNA binding protein